MRYLAFLAFLLVPFTMIRAQDQTLEYFIARAQENAPVLKANNNLQKVGELQQKIILAQSKAFQVNATSEVMVSPYFDNKGRVIDITTNPSPTAYGYDVGITNGGLYSAQLNVTKNLFNQAAVHNLLFQNKIQGNAIALSSEETTHNLIRTITDTYVLAFQLQLQENYTQDLLNDLEKRLQVVEILVKRGVLMESDFLLLQLDIEGKKLELQQIRNNFQTISNQLYSLSGLRAGSMARLSEPYFDSSEDPASFFYEKKFENDSLLVVADQSLYENQYKPQLSAYANTGLNAVELQNLEHRVGVSAGLRLTVPIYDGRQRKYNALQSVLKRESLTYYKEHSKIQLENTLKNIRNQIKDLELNRLSIEKQLRQQEKILEIYKGKLVQGQVSIVDYLNVVQNYKYNVQTKLQMQTNRWLLQSQYNFMNW